MAIRHSEDTARRTRREQRRGELHTRLPDHYCDRCTAVVYDEDRECLECGVGRPAAGWRLLDDRVDPWIGQVLGQRYLLTKLLGQGASGAVYRAESLSISRQFAIKLIRLTTAGRGPDPELIRARLDREVEAIGRLRNPHVVPFYDVLELPQQWVGVVMDFIEGRTLERVIIEEGRLELGRACRILRQVANGIHEAHRAGLIHRDLKPENLMVERLPAGDDFVHILDFGVCWMEDAVSVTEGFVGTPLYASPEQAVGGAVDARADIYALGAIFFCMLTGRPPFEAKSVVEVLSAHVKEVPPRISQVAPDARFPQVIDDLVAQMLEKNPNRRPSTLSEVIDALDRLPALRRRDDSGERQMAVLRRRQLADSSSVAEQTAVGAASSAAEVEVAAAESATGVSGTATGAVFANERSHPSEAAADSPAEESFPPAASTTGGMRVERTLDSDSGGSAHPFMHMRASSVHPAPGGRGGKTRHGLADPGRLGSEGGDGAPEEADSDSGPPGLSKVRVPFDGRKTAWGCDHQHRLTYASGDDLFLLKMVPRAQLDLSVDRDAQPSALALSTHHLLVGFDDGSIGSIDTDDGQFESLFSDVRRQPMTAVGCDDRRFLMVAGSSSGRLYMYRAHRDEPDWARVGGGSAVAAVAVADSGDVFAVGRDDRSICVYNASEPKRAVFEHTAQRRILSLAFSRDGHLLACVHDDGSLSLFHVVAGRTIFALPSIDPDCFGVCFGRDQQLTAICCERN